MTSNAFALRQSGSTVVKRIVAAALCALLALAGAVDLVAAGERFPGADWERADPASTGWSKAKLTKAEAWSKRIGSIAVMIVHHGAVVAEWGDTAAKTPLASVRKSLLSALIGNAVERGEMNLAQTIGALGIDDNEPSLTVEEKTATVHDLLKARSGIYHAALYETPGMAAARPPRFSHAPGMFWYYNNWDFNALGTIYERAVRSSIFEAFEREIARPTAMQDYRPTDGEYVTGADSIHRAYPFKMSARDLARFGLLYLRKGQWEGRQVVPAHWVEESARAYSSSESGPGYGYLWWTEPINNGVAPSVTLPQGTFFARGAGGQYAFVIPGHDLVVVHRAAHVADGGVSLWQVGRLLWLVLDAGGFPGIGPDTSIEAAPGARVNSEALSRMLAGKTLFYGDSAMGGPYRLRIGADGRAALLRGREPVEVDTGTWRISADQFCRDWKKTKPSSRCFAVVGDGAKVQLFDRMGLMFIDARIVDD